MLEMTMITTAERGLRRQRERRQNPDQARQALLARRDADATDSALPDERPARPRVGPPRPLPRLRPHALT